MGKTAMSGYTKVICVARGHSSGKVTMRVNGATELYPGYVCTCTGQTWPDIHKPDAIGESAFGICGLKANQDVDAVFADDAEIPVYTTGSGAIVYGYHKGTPSGGSIVAGDILVACGVEDNGFVAPLAKQIDAITTADATSTVQATTLKHLFSIVGRAAETHASATNDTPIKILLSI